VGLIPRGGSSPLQRICETCTGFSRLAARQVHAGGRMGTVVDGVQAPTRERNFRSGNSDPMVRSRRVVALEPVRVVVELRQEEPPAQRAMGDAEG
jgi:hypothetical protein